MVKGNSMMKPISYLLVAVLGFAAGGTAAYFYLARPENRPARAEKPYYETLTLDSPEAAVHEFLRAWQIDDYCTAYLVLAAETQYTFYVTLATGDMEAIFSDPLRVQERLKDVDFKPGSQEHSLAGGLGNFELFVGAAKEAGGLPVELETPMSIRGTEIIEAERGSRMVDVKATCKSHSSIVFRTIQSKSGRWRLLYVILPDDDPPLTWPVPAAASWLPQPKRATLDEQ
jgi:hypothetical protein